MILLNKGASNTIALSLKEKETLSSPYYLWRFISEGLATEVSVVMAFTSQSERCEEWTFIEGTTATLPSGISEYRIYEQSDPANTNWLSAGTLLETGLAKVHGTPTDSYVPQSYSETFSTPQ